MTTIIRDDLRCAECGHHTFELWQERGPDEVRVGGYGSGRADGVIVAICRKCKAESCIMPQQTPHLEVDGMLVGGWSTPREEEDEG